MDLEIIFIDVLEWNQSNPDDIWGFQIWSAAILDFFPKGLAYDFGSKFQISFNFVYSQIEPKNKILLMFKSKIYVILTIYDDVKFDQPQSWIFLQRG